MSDFDNSDQRGNGQQGAEQPGKERPDVETPNPSQEPVPIQPPAPPEYTPDHGPVGPTPVETPAHPEQPVELPTPNPDRATPDSPPQPPEISPPPANYCIGARVRSNVVDFGRYYRMAQRRGNGNSPLTA